MKESLILLCHGSSDPIWMSSFERLRDRLGRQLGSDRVKLACLQFGRPDFCTAVEQAQRERCRRIRVLPLFLSAGGHVARDVPPLLARARDRCPGIRIELLPPVGEDERFAALVEELAREALEDSDDPR